MYSSCVAFSELLDGVLPLFSMGKWSLREAAYLATACCCFDRRFSPSPRSVHYLRMCRLQFSAEKAVTFSMCMLYRQWDSDVHPGLFIKNRSYDCSLMHPKPVRFCLLVCLWTQKDLFWLVMWTAAPVEPCSGARDTPHLLSAQTVKNFEFEPHWCHPFYTRILGGSQNVHFLCIYMATARLRKWALSHCQKINR